MNFFEAVLEEERILTDAGIRREELSINRYRAENERLSIENERLRLENERMKIELIRAGLRPEEVIRPSKRPVVKPTLIPNTVAQLGFS